MPCILYARNRLSPGTLLTFSPAGRLPWQPGPSGPGTNKVLGRAGLRALLFATVASGGRLARSPEGTRMGTYLPRINYARYGPQEPGSSGPWPKQSQPNPPSPVRHEPGILLPT